MKLKERVRLFCGGVIRDVRRARRMAKLYDRAHRIKRLHLGKQLYTYWRHQVSRQMIEECAEVGYNMLLDFKVHARVLSRR